MKIDSNTRFEIIGELYYRDTKYLRPGKSAVDYDTCDPENQQRFDQWFATRAFNAAIEHIARLEDGDAEPVFG